MKVWKHFLIITQHKIMVMKHCFRVGLYRQGLLHDLSKYTWAEFKVGCKYYQGTRSPNNAERENTGVSLAWLHHKGRNKHHFEYWIDYDSKGNGLTGMKMPEKYVIEMFMDRVAASKIYLKKAYTNHAPLAYYKAGKPSMILHKESQTLLEKFLYLLDEHGEEKTFAYIKDLVQNKEGA